MERLEAGLRWRLLSRDNGFQEVLALANVRNDLFSRRARDSGDTDLDRERHVVPQSRVVLDLALAVNSKEELVGAGNKSLGQPRAYITDHPAYMVHLLRIMARVILSTSPPSSASLGKVGNVVPGGLSMATWNRGTTVMAGFCWVASGGVVVDKW